MLALSRTLAALIASLLMTSPVFAVDDLNNDTTNRDSHRYSTVPTATKVAASTQTKKTGQNSPQMISADAAAAMVGQYVTMCDKVAQTKGFRRGLYLNFKYRYPYQKITGVIWTSALTDLKKQLGPIEDLVNKNVCLRGKISMYNGRVQIKVNKANQVFLQS